MGEGFCHQHEPWVGQLMSQILRFGILSGPVMFLLQIYGPGVSNPDHRRHHDTYNGCGVNLSQDWEEADRCRAAATTKRMRSKYGWGPGGSLHAQ